LYDIKIGDGEYDVDISTFSILVESEKNRKFIGTSLTGVKLILYN
jgi:hypothetical protein